MKFQYNTKAGKIEIEIIDGKAICRSNIAGKNTIGEAVNPQHWQGKEAGLFLQKSRIYVQNTKAHNEVKAAIKNTLVTEPVPEFIEKELNADGMKFTAANIINPEYSQKMKWSNTTIKGEDGFAYKDKSI